MKKKLDKDMLAYRILGACNPSLAWEAIGVEPGRRYVAVQCHTARDPGGR